MGANKPSRFGGKDPRYKTRDRATFVDIAPVESGGWGHDSHLADRQMENWKIAKPAGRPSNFCKVAPEPELADAVKRYLAAHNTALAPSEASIKLDSHNNEILALPGHIRLETHIHEPMQGTPTAHDILLQMFAEKKIGQGLFHAGRRWQWDREAATIQSSVSIDWSRSSPSPYQSDEMNERQWAAIRRRRQFTTHSGLAAATMLDFLLDADRGRSKLIQLTGLPAVQIECALEELLEKVCDCFAE